MNRLATLWAPTVLLPALAFAAAQPKTVSFKSADGWTIVGSYHPGKKGAATAILVHGVGAGRGEWQDFEPQLWKLGLGTLSIDLRGHGESKKGPAGQRTYESFSSNDWASAQEDIQAAQTFLAARGLKKVGLVGGSIGANLSSRQAAASSDVAWVVLLSPGIDYRGVSLSDVPGRPELVAASGGDPYALQTAMGLLNRDNVTFLQASSGHGAQMLRDPDFVKKLLAWIAAR